MQISKNPQTKADFSQWVLTVYQLGPVPYVTGLYCSAPWNLVPFLQSACRFNKMKRGILGCQCFEMLLLQHADLFLLTHRHPEVLPQLQYGTNQPLPAGSLHLKLIWFCMFDLK